jgi:hypothetical protein
MQFNNKANLKEWHNKMLKESKNHPVLEGLEESWDLLSNHYNTPMEGVIDRNDIAQNTPLDAFRYMIEAGYYPPPEVLLALNDCFDMYMALRGKVELEQIFFGEKKRGIGNHAARTYKDKAYKHLWAELMVNRAYEQKSQVEIAESVIDLFELKDDVDSFLRGYRRYLVNFKSKPSDN